MYLEMNFKRFFLVILFLLTIALLVPKNSIAAETDGILASVDSTITKIQEEIKYLFTFKVENKVQVLEKNAEKRLTWAQNYANEGNNEGVQNMIQSYQQIKERQNSLLGKIDGQVLGAVADNTIEQQKTMEDIKTKINNEVKNEIIQVQEKVVNQVAERIVVVNGTEGQTEFFNKVEHVWAPGTEPKDGQPHTAGVVIEGGTMQFAPGTSAGSGTKDIKTVEVKTGGTVNEPVPVGGDMNITTDTNLNGPVNTIDDTYDDNNLTIDP
jgi:6-pyruvoyl-tetrahydropterin synthase